jgi:hypothetical protein
LRFHFHVTQQRVCVGLFQVVIEHARAAHRILTAGMYYAPTALHRAALDAYVDIANACDDADYCEYLNAGDTFTWKRLLEKASSGKNPLLKAIAQAECFEAGRHIYAERARQLERKGYKKLEPAERFARAGMTHVYEAAYTMLSAEAHNNLGFITHHYFDARGERPVMRTVSSRPENGAPLAMTLNMAEIVVDAADKVLCLCGHGTAVLSVVREKIVSINDRLIAALPPDNPARSAS